MRPSWKMDVANMLDTVPFYFNWLSEWLLNYQANQDRPCGATRVVNAYSSDASTADYNKFYINISSFK